MSLANNPDQRRLALVHRARPGLRRAGWFLRFTVSINQRQQRAAVPGIGDWIARGALRVMLSGDDIGPLIGRLNQTANFLLTAGVADGTWA
jgi:hypothetical protein